MKIAIITCFLTEGYMNINASHILSLIFQIQQKTNFDYNSILISVLLISTIITYYKLNYPFFFKRYFNPKHIIYLGNQEDYFFRSNLFSNANIFPLLIYSLVISFFSIYVFEDSDTELLKSIIELNLLQKWIVITLLFLFFVILRIIFIFLIFYFIDFSKKFKKIFILNFIRITINISFISITLSYILYEVLSFDIAYKFLILTKVIIVILRPLILYNFSQKLIQDKTTQIILLILFADLLPSIIVFDPIMLISFFDQILAYFDIANI